MALVLPPLRMISYSSVSPDYPAFSSSTGLMGTINYRHDTIFQFDGTEIIDPFKEISAVILNFHVSTISGVSGQVASLDVMSVTNTSNLLITSVTYNTVSNYRTGIRTIGYIDFPGITTLGYIAIYLDTTVVSNIQKNATQQVLTLESYSSQTKKEISFDDMKLVIQYTDLPSYPPSSLMPNQNENPNRDIAFSWTHTPNPSLGAVDPQTGWRLEVWQNSVPAVIVEQGNANNSYVLPGGTFSQFATLHYRVRTATANNGWGQWANGDVSMIYLPAYAPASVIPTTPQNPNRPIVFSWSHNPNSGLNYADPQTGWSLEIWQDGVTPIIVTQSNATNTYTLDANTFVLGKNLNFRVRTATQYNGWGAYANGSVAMQLTPPYAPAALLPQSPQNPRGEIMFSWWHVANPSVLYSDPQTAWELKIWQSGKTPIIITQYDATNAYTLAENTFTLYDPVLFEVKTATQYNGFGAIASSTFILRTTPPNAPLLIAPAANAVALGASGVNLRWAYASDFDTHWSSFDYQYRVDGGAWVQKNTIETNATTGAIITESVVGWQVRAYGALGDVGEWSAIRSFGTIGKPPTPIIVSVDATNRPIVFFSAQNPLSFQVIINSYSSAPIAGEGYGQVYDSGNILFENAFNYQITELLPNGNYFVYFRITSYYGEISDWAQYPFRIQKDSIAAPYLQINTSNNKYIILTFNNSTYPKYIYRDGVRIAKTSSSATTWLDYTAMPNVTHIYQVMIANSAWMFGRSNTVSANISFTEMTLAPADDLGNMLILHKMLDGDPTKNMSLTQQKTISYFNGRQKPIVQFGEHLTKTLDFVFFINAEERKHLEDITLSTEMLLLRDESLGVFWGDIASDPNIKFETVQNGYIASFGFQELDHNEVVPL